MKTHQKSFIKTCSRTAIWEAVDRGVSLPPPAPNLDLTAPCILLPLSEQRALPALKFLLFSLPSISIYIISFLLPSCLLPPPAPFTSPPTSSSPYLLTCLPPNFKKGWSRKCKKDYARGKTPTDWRTTDEALINNDNSSFEHSAPVIALQIQKNAKKILRKHKIILGLQRKTAITL